MNARDLKVDLAKLKFLIYGPSGAGKTYQIQGFPNPYVFDTDGGMLTLAGADVEYDTYVDVDVKKPTAWKAIEKKVEELTKDPGEIKTVVFDSLSTLQDRLMMNVQAINGRPGQTATQQEYGIMIDKLEEFFNTKVLGLPMNVVVLAHEQMLQDGVTGEIFVTPLITGKKLPHKMPMFFDEVYRVSNDKDSKGNRVWKFMTCADRRYQAKTRIPALLRAKEVVLGEGELLYPTILKMAATATTIN